MGIRDLQLQIGGGRAGQFFHGHQILPFSVALHVLDHPLGGAHHRVFLNADANRFRVVGKEEVCVGDDFAVVEVVTGEQDAVVIHGDQVSFVGGGAALGKGGYVNGGIAQVLVDHGVGQVVGVDLIFAGDGQVVVGGKGTVGMTAEVDHVGIFVEDLINLFGGVVALGHKSVAVLAPFGAGGGPVLIHTEAAFHGVVVENQINVAVIIAGVIIVFQHFFQPDQLIGRQMLVGIFAAGVAKGADSQIDEQIFSVGNGVVVIGIIGGEGDVVFVVCTRIIDVCVGIKGVLHVLQRLGGGDRQFALIVRRGGARKLLQIPGQNVVVAQNAPQGEIPAAGRVGVGEDLVLGCVASFGEVTHGDGEVDVGRFKEVHGGGKGRGGVGRAEVNIGYDAVGIFLVSEGEQTVCGEFHAAGFRSVQIEPQAGGVGGNRHAVGDGVGQYRAVDGEAVHERQGGVSAERTVAIAPVEGKFALFIVLGKGDGDGALGHSGGAEIKGVIQLGQTVHHDGIGLLRAVGEGDGQGEGAIFRRSCDLGLGQGCLIVGKNGVQSGLHRRFREVVGGGDAVDAILHLFQLCVHVNGLGISHEGFEHGQISGGSAGGLHRPGGVCSRRQRCKVGCVGRGEDIHDFRGVQIVIVDGATEAFREHKARKSHVARAGGDVDNVGVFLILKK